MGRDYALTMPQIKESARKYRAGLSSHTIAAEFGVSAHAVRNALRLAGVPMRERASAVRMDLVRKLAVKPPRHDIGRWHWINPANADKWTTNGSRLVAA